MDYKKIYNNIIHNARQRTIEGYTEKHHVIPKSLGGVDSLDNIVELTAREHFICHILLTKFTKGQDKNKMIRAVMLMKGANQLQSRYVNSRLYETARKEYATKRSIEQTGKNNTFYNMKHSKQSKEKMSASKKELYRDGKHPHIGMKRSDETKKKISEARKGQPSPLKGRKVGPMSSEAKEKMKQARQGKSFWWTDGTNNVRAETCPIGYKKGRTMSPSHLAKFAKVSS